MESISLDALLGDGDLASDDVKACCASIYESEPVAWLLGGQLHPGGEALTRRTAQLAAIGAGDRVLDVASGHGGTARLLARELGAKVVGLELGAGAVAGARAATAEAGLSNAVEFVEGDAEALPFEAGEFDAIVCECSLCTFPEKVTAANELARVLSGGGRVAIADVTAEPERLPAPLRAAAARVACVADALPADGYATLLEDAGLEVTMRESHDHALAAMVDRVEARLRLARMLRTPQTAPYRTQIEPAIELARLARRAIEDGVLGYSVIVARASG